MLININPILGPNLLCTLNEMGHGDTLVLSDANFPANSISQNVIRLDGVNMTEAAKAILSVFPLDSFIKYPVKRMEIDNEPNKINQIHQDFIDTVKTVSGEKWKIGTIERFQFYKEAKNAYAIVSTTDARPFGCFLLTKGVIKPDGTVW